MEFVMSGESGKLWSLKLFLLRKSYLYVTLKGLKQLKVDRNF